MKTLGKIFSFASVWLMALLVAGADCKNIVIATSSVVLTNTPIWVGIERKFFEDAGLRVDTSSCVRTSPSRG